MRNQDEDLNIAIVSGFFSPFSDSDCLNCKLSLEDGYFGRVSTILKGAPDSLYHRGYQSATFENSDIALTRVLVLL